MSILHRLVPGCSAAGLRGATYQCFREPLTKLLTCCYFAATNADGTGGTCSNAGPYPACCPAFSRASDRCNLPDGTATCSLKTYPVPACCDEDYCYVFTDASTTQCTDGKVGIAQSLLNTHSHSVSCFDKFWRHAAAGPVHGLTRLRL